MSLAPTKLMTAKEFAALPDPPDGSKQELVRGVIVTMPPPQFPHGNCQGNVYFVLKMYARQTNNGWVTVETGVVTERDPDTMRGPDVAYWSNERLPPEQMPEGYPEVAPDLAVEVLPPSNTRARVREKIREYFRSNVRMVWMVDPEERAVTVYRRPGSGLVLWDDAMLTGEEVLPGFSCAVADLFAR